MAAMISPQVAHSSGKHSEVWSPLPLTFSYQVAFAPSTFGSKVLMQLRYEGLLTEAH
jgi:hypothetical protein